MPEYCHCKRHGYKTEEVTQDVRYSQKFGHTQTFDWYCMHAKIAASLIEWKIVHAKFHSPVQQDTVARSPKVTGFPALHLIVVTPVYICSSVSGFRALASK